MRKKATKLSRGEQPAPVSTGPPPVAEALSWTTARYRFHTFAYRDPRSSFSSAVGLPVVSPTAVLLGVASTLFSLGESQMAAEFMAQAHLCEVVIDPPDGMIFFRAFHEIRRYETDKYGPNPRIGLTDINQGTREYGLVGGEMAVYVGAPAGLRAHVQLALRNRDHLGTHDSLCSLVGDAGPCEEPVSVVYRPLIGKEIEFRPEGPLTVLTLSRFKQTGQPLSPTVGGHWWIAGGDNTELVPYLIRGGFSGTARGKIYKKT